MLRENPRKASEIAISHCILSDIQCKAFSFRQCTASSFTPSTFLFSTCLCCAACFSDTACTNAARIASSSGISCCMEKQFNRGKNDRLALILGILYQRSTAWWQTVAPKRACGRFDANQKKLGREIGSRHRACLH